jgi:hypothetical protein
MANDFNCVDYSRGRNFRQIASLLVDTKSKASSVRYSTLVAQEATDGLTASIPVEAIQSAYNQLASGRLTTTVRRTLNNIVGSYVSSPAKENSSDDEPEEGESTTFVTQASTMRLTNRRRRSTSMQ